MLLFINIDLYLLIPAVITQIFNRTAEIVIAIGIPAKEANAEMETHPLTVETKMVKCSIKFKTPQTFLCFLLIKWF